MAKEDLIKRDGSQGLGQPSRPQPVPRANESHEAGTAAFGKAYSDPSTVGHYDERRAFEAAHGTPSPRQRGEVVPEGKTADPGGGATVPAPLD
jgi:hypothetical protein